MKDSNHKLTRAYSGTEITASILRDMLKNENIEAIIKNESESGRIAGFGTQGGSDVYIMEKDVEKARPIIEDFTNRNS